MPGPSIGDAEEEATQHCEGQVSGCRGGGHPAMPGPIISDAEEETTAHVAATQGGSIIQDTISKQKNVFRYLSRVEFHYICLIIIRNKYY